jgi:hypothetical protein
MNIRILPEAERDLELGADFYESQRVGLGRYFNDCLMADIESLRIYAGVHERVCDLYRCLSKRFPFAIFEPAADASSNYPDGGVRPIESKVQGRLRPTFGSTAISRVT